ncbi:MAG: cohesin domain-containing protein [Candidatus Sumerlaeota bacterium]|nr:cohesin domain-containing protein [Candidatus Sumerlaeota bacterium]
MRLLSVLLMLLATTTFAQVISLSNPMAAPGSTVNIDLSGPGGNTAGINFAIKYDPAVLSNPQMSVGALTLGCKSDYNDVKINNVLTGELRGIIYNDPVQSFLAGPGVIATISFKVAASAPSCTPTNLQLLTSTSEQFGISNTAGVSTTGNYTTLDGSVNVTLSGDFDNNGTVDDDDFALLAFNYGILYNDDDFANLAFNYGMNCP